MKTINNKRFLKHWLIFVINVFILTGCDKYRYGLVDDEYGQKDPICVAVSNKYEQEAKTNCLAVLKWYDMVYPNGQKLHCEKMRDSK